ncbi:MAG: U32 family peptidase [Lentisphaeria bacterium]|nr:U32 family peptidase [Lentisphaeria bacterium]
MAMRFSLAANYDMDLVPLLRRFPVYEVYGKLPADVVGGGRPSYMGAPLHREALRAYVQALAAQGIAFNYLLNSSCLGNREWDRRWQRQFHRLMETLRGMGVQRLTVSIPYLLEVIRERFPEMHVRVGIFAQVDTPARARFWEDLGADAITLESFSINRDFPRLRAIRAAVSCELQLIANHVCLPNCPLQPYHQNGFAHSSDASGRLFLDACILTCARKRLEAPGLFLKSNWIRPEDVGAYEALGFDSFKLLERGMPSTEALRRLEAYTARSFEGNLAELLLSYGFTEAPRTARGWSLKHFLRPRAVLPWRLAPVLALARQQGMMFARPGSPIMIDNRRIPPEFLSRVSACGGTANGCGTCRYCDDLATEAVTVDPEFRADSLERFEAVRRSLAGGSMWGV